MNVLQGKIIFECEKEVAYDSPDHVQPEGTRRDNSTNPLFNEKLYRLFGRGNQLKVLDLGCSGGGFVKQCIDQGHFAVGLEGSNYSKNFKRAEWRTIPNNLFTCDITRNFDILIKNNNQKKRVLFNVITCWEVMEHIKEEDLIKVTENVKKHLASNGIWIMSIATNEDIVKGIRLHQTVKSKSWWIDKFKKLGFIVKEDFKEYFKNQFVRGPFQGDGGFNLVLVPKGNNPPSLPKVSFKRNLWEHWMGSRVYKMIKVILKA